MRAIKHIKAGLLNAADGLMDKLGPGRFLAAGLAVLGAAWVLGRHGTMGGTENEQ